MRATKIWFGLLILFFFVVIILAPFGLMYFTENRFNSIIVYEQSESNSCHINLIEPTIILRIDDVRAYSKLTKPVVDEILSRDLSVVLGVIPDDMGDDNNIRGYLRAVKANPLAEIAQHGFNHSESDINITEEDLIKGNYIIQKSLGVFPVTYIPPFNEISPESKEIVSNYFNIFSGEEGIMKEGLQIAEIGQTIGTYDYDNNLKIPIEEVINKCEESLQRINVCVVTIHPQEYAKNITNTIEVDEDKFEDFKEMLDNLQNLDVKFSTFHELVVCSE